MTKGSFLLFLLFLICKVNGQLPPLALEAQPSVVQGHMCRAKSLCFWQNHELTWALVRKRPRPHVADWNIQPPCWLRVTHQTRGMSKHAISCRVRAFFWLSLSSPQTPQEQRLPGSHEDSSEKGGLLSWWVRVLTGCEPRDQLGEKAKLYLEAL